MSERILRLEPTREKYLKIKNKFGHFYFLIFVKIFKATEQMGQN
jgi:hypothetical protein